MTSQVTGEGEITHNKQQHCDSILPEYVRTFSRWCPPLVSITSSCSSWLSIHTVCRGIFKLLVKFQLENKDNTSYTGMKSIYNLFFVQMFLGHYVWVAFRICTLNFKNGCLPYWFTLTFVKQEKVLIDNCAQDCHSKTSTSVAERHSWSIPTSPWGPSWLSSETTNWSAHERCVQLLFGSQTVLLKGPSNMFFSL